MELGQARRNILLLMDSTKNWMPDHKHSPDFRLYVFIFPSYSCTHVQSLISVAWSWVKRDGTQCNGGRLSSEMPGHTVDSCKCLCEQNPLCQAFAVGGNGNCVLFDSCDDVWVSGYYVSYTNRPETISTECQQITANEATNMSPEITTETPETTSMSPTFTSKFPKTTTCKCFFSV